MIDRLEALILKQNQLKRKLYTSYLNHLPEDLISTLKKQKVLVEEEIKEMQKNPANGDSGSNSSDSEKVA